MTAPTECPIVITMGDPSGVGPEVTVKALATLGAAERRAFAVIGDRTVLGRALAASGLDIALVAPGGDGISVIDVPVDGLPDRFGILSPRCGEAVFQYIRTAVEWAEAGKAAGIVTAPINKEALNSAGHHYDGHTGMLAHLTGQKASWMLLASERLNVIHVSTHVSLRTAIDRATPERVLETIRAGHRHLRRMGIAAPRIAVAGINPHCGENGLFGTEDVDDPRAGGRRGAGRGHRRRSARSRPTPSITAPITAPSTSWWRSITTRGTSRSSWSPSTRR